MRRPAGQPVRSSADLAWCARALEALQQACRAFELRYGPDLQREFGLVVHCTYKHETASQQYDPKDWTVPINRRSHCLITFDVALPNLTSTQCQVRYCDIGRGIPFAVQLLSTVRRQKAHQKALEATSSSGCPCVLRGFVGEEDGQHLILDTNIIFEWLHVSKLDNGPYLCQISYHNLVSPGRAVPNCPLRIAGRPGLVYSVEFLDEFARNICSGLEFRGVVYEGSSLALERALPLGGVDILDQPVYWLWPNGVLRCASARALHRSRGLGHTSWSASLLAS